MKTKIMIAILLLFSLSNCDKHIPKMDQEWQLVYKNDKHGNSVSGNKEELIKVVRNGHPIRIGWSSKRRNDSTKTVEHFIDAEFLTIANGQEVFAQIKPFLGQRPDLTSDTLSMTLLPNKLHWILGTNGTISSVNRDYRKDSVIQNSPSTFRYDIGWYSKK